MNTTFILFSGLEVNDDFNENINLVVQDLKGQGYTMESYVKLTLSQINTMVPNGKVLESKFNKDKNRHELIWIGDVQIPLKFKQYLIQKEDKFYILTLTTLPETFLEFEKTGKEILNSFQVK